MNKKSSGRSVNRAKIVSLKGIPCPVAFSTRLRAEPGVACESAIEPDNPSVETTNPVYAAATSQPKSTRTRLAISRANRAAVTNPKPQFSHEAHIATRTVSEMAVRGLVVSDAAFSRQE